MPPFETMDCHQRALLWSKTGEDNYADILVAAPVEIRVRWDDSAREGLDPQGNKIQLTATIVAKQELQLGDCLWLAPNSAYSAMEQYTGTGSGGDDTDIHQVAAFFNTTPDIKNRNIRRTAGLVRYRGTPPEQSP